MAMTVMGSVTVIQSSALMAPSVTLPPMRVEGLRVRFLGFAAAGSKRSQTTKRVSQAAKKPNFSGSVARLSTSWRSDIGLSSIGR